jgi:hypothetical protein
LKTKKVMGFLLAISMMVSLICPAFAADKVSDLKTDATEYQFGATMTITGKATAGQEYVGLQIIKDSKTIWLDEVKTSGGDFERKLPLPAKANDQWTDGQYTLKADGASTQFSIKTNTVLPKVTISLPTSVKVNTRFKIGFGGELEKVKDARLEIEVSNGDLNNDFYLYQDGSRVSTMTLTADTASKFKNNVEMSFQNVFTANRKDFPVTVTMYDGNNNKVKSYSQTVKATRTNNTDDDDDNGGSGTGGGGIYFPGGTTDITGGLGGFGVTSIIDGKNATITGNKLTDKSFTVSVMVGGALQSTFASPIVVKAPYTPSASNLANVVVKDQFGNVIARSAVSGNSIMFATTDTNGTFTIEEITKSFTDVNHPWAQDAITGLAARNVINGVGDSLYDPDRTVTRAEYIKMIVTMFGAPIGTTDSGFADVSSDAWYAPYVAAAKNSGITTGYGDGNFGPNDQISRQDMSVMLYRAAQKFGVSLNPATNPLVFIDDSFIADYAKDAVYTMQKAGILKGVGDNRFDPTSSSTRAQSAVAIYNMMKVSVGAN